MSPSQRHPADELYELREKLHRVREREELLRDFLAAIGETGGREIGRAGPLGDIVMEDMRRLSHCAETVHSPPWEGGGPAGALFDRVRDENEPFVLVARSAG